MSRALNVGGFPLRWQHKGAGVNHHMFNRPAAAIVFAFMLTAFPQVHACGLEPTLRGGFTISYPGALDVAVAVAAARREGLLPPAESEVIANDVRLRQMLADLRHFKSRLGEASAQGKGMGQAPFSLVLVGPGLWSHFYLTPGGVLARYHTEGPLNDKTVVLTHHAVLRALLNGDLTTTQAAELGLIAYSGSEAQPVRSAFETGLELSS